MNDNGMYEIFELITDFQKEDILSTGQEPTDNRLFQDAISPHEDNVGINILITETWYLKVLTIY